MEPMSDWQVVWLVLRDSPLLVVPAILAFWWVCGLILTGRAIGWRDFHENDPWNK